MFAIVSTMACIVIPLPNKRGYAVSLQVTTYHFVHQILPDSVEVTINQTVTLTGGGRGKNTVKWYTEYWVKSQVLHQTAILQYLYIMLTVLLDLPLQLHTAQ